jgi:hypothetical protein
MENEFETFIGAGKHERSEDWVDYRNWSRKNLEKIFDTTVL